MYSENSCPSALVIDFPGENKIRKCTPNSVGIYFQKFLTSGADGERGRTKKQYKNR